MESQPRQGPVAAVADQVDAGSNLLYILTGEESRVLRHLQDMASCMFTTPRSLAHWSITDGYEGGPADLAKGSAKGEPLAALDQVLVHSASDCFFVLKDFQAFMTDERIIRRLRDIMEVLSQSEACVILLCPSLMLPEAIAKDVPVLDYPLPDQGEIELAVGTALAIVSQRLEEIVAVPSEDRENINRTLQGLSWNEIVRVVRKVGIARGKIDHTVTEALLEEKRQIIRKSEILDYIATGLRLQDVGGLKVFKGWAKTRARGFSRAAAAYGLPKPKGILFTGISGCGKSLAIQALANYWNMPLLRLDMGRVFAGIAGGPEESFRRALKTVEAVAPAILWIDEIEMGISVFSDSIESGSTSRIFAMFLTWMQEKSAPVFVGATANDIDRLPPEFIRKGRFDEIFFVDLPNQQERHQIFKVHLTNRGKDISDISVEGLAKGTEGYSGAEIEQGIISAMYDAFAEGRELTIGDIYRALDRMVPLSVTMKEQIIKTKRWAENRAMRAN